MVIYVIYDTEAALKGWAESQGCKHWNRPNAGGGRECIGVYATKVSSRHRLC